MKKQLLLIAAAATMFAACTMNDNFNEITQEKSNEAIGFSTYSTRQTRGTAENSTATSTEGLENYNTHFLVWGYKNAMKADKSGAEDVYQFGKDGANYPGTVVQYADPAWSYSPLRFWDKSAYYYRFFAAAPANKNWQYTSTAGSGKLVLNNFTIKGENRVLVGNTTENAIDAPLGVSAGTAITSTEIDSKATLSNLNDEDLMISTDLEIAPTTYGNDVVLEFNHILSRLNIGVRKSKDLANYNVYLKTIKVCNLIKQASFDEGRALTTANAGIYDPDKTASTPRATLLSKGTAARWQAAATPVRFTDTDNSMRYYVDANNDGADPLTINAVEPASGTDDKYNYVYQGLIIPQTITYEATQLSTAASGFKMDGSTASNASNPYILIEYEIWAPAEAARTYVETDPEVRNGSANVGDQKDAVASYKLDSYKYYYNLAEVFNGNAVLTPGDITFCEGYQNTLKITLAPAAIVFDPVVFHWDNVPVEYDIE